MNDTEPYANDALRWVAIDVRYPTWERAETLPDQISAGLRRKFPIAESQSQMALTVGTTGPSAQQVPLHRFSQRDRLMSVTLTPDALTIETTSYPGWKALRAVVQDVLEVVAGPDQPAGIGRVGVRFIDEIRLPADAQGIQRWAGWISDAILAPFALRHEEEPSAGTIVLQFGTAPGFVTVFRAAPYDSGRTVQEQGPLRSPKHTPDGPYFLFDTDASWADPEGIVPEYSSELVLEVLDTLHRSCIDTFESSITEQLRREVLRKEDKTP